MSGKIINVPDEFRPTHQVRYPAHQNGPRCEEYCDQYFREFEAKTSAWYLPIFWDTYLVTHGFGRNIGDLQGWYDDNIRYDSRKFWTVCEYADGIKIDASPNLHIFYCARDGGTTLPLLCDPHPSNRKENPTFLASFIGAIATHPVRQKMLERLSREPGFYVSGPQGTEQFRNIMDDSWFALCPRGYGPTSYRLFEAIQMGCIPVYIYDNMVLPYRDELDWTTFSIMLKLHQINDIPAILKSINIDTRRWKQKKLEKVQSWFTMDGMAKYVKTYLEVRWPE